MTTQEEKEIPYICFVTIILLLAVIFLLHKFYE